MSNLSTSDIRILLILALLVGVAIFARPIWHWIKAGDKPRLLDQRITDPWVRTYRAKHQSEAILAARADIMATCPGFHISTMNWENRGPGIGRVVPSGSSPGQPGRRAS